MKIDRSTIDRFLEPKLLRALARLPLMSPRVVEGAMVGSHRSPSTGFSTEFADHRGYVKGDDLRHLDWKVFSRTEKYYIKRYEENTNLRAHIMRHTEKAFDDFAGAAHDAAQLKRMLGL